MGVLDRCETVAEGVADGALFEDSSFNASLYFCNKGVLYEKCGGEIYDPELQFCEDDKPVALCGGEPYDIKTHMCVDDEAVSAWACCSPEGQNENWCNLHEDSKYDVRTHFCDKRKNKDGETRIYRFKTITDKEGAYSETWMLENLNFDNTANDESACANGDPANCSKYGRHYTWEAANMYCPTGWHLPKVSEYKDLMSYDDTKNPTYFNLQFGGLYGVYMGQTEIKWRDVGSYMELWTADELSSDKAECLYLNSTSDFTVWNNDNAQNKTNMRSVRCIKNK